MFSRKSEYGSPFFSMDSGRVSKDGENSQNINKILNNYVKNRQLDNLRKASGFSKLSPFICSFFGLLGAKFFNDAFVGPRSFYLRGCIFLLAGFVGFKIYFSYDQHQTYVNVLNQFKEKTLDPEIQKMIENNDFRYARKRLNLPSEEEEKMI